MADRLELPDNGTATRNFVPRVRAMKWEWLVIRDKRQVSRVSVGELQGRKSLEKLGIGCKNNVKVDHEIGGCELD